MKLAVSYGIFLVGLLGGVANEYHQEIGSGFSDANGLSNSLISLLRSLLKS